MNYALNDKDVQIHIDDAKSGEHYKCPECKQRATARKGEVYRHHFSHYGQTKCGFYDSFPVAQLPKEVDHGPQNPTLDTPNVCPYKEAKDRADAQQVEKDKKRKKTSDERRAYVQMRVRQSGHGDTITPAKRVYHETEDVCDACRGTGQMYYGSDVEGNCIMCDISG